MDYHLFFTENTTISAKLVYLQGERFTIHYGTGQTAPFTVGDYLLLAHKGESFVLPYTFRIVNMNRQAYTVVIEVEAIYTYALPFQAVLSLLTLSRPEVYLTSSSAHGSLSKPEFIAIINFMSMSGIFYEKSLLEEKVVRERPENYVDTVESDTTEIYSIEEKEEEIIFSEHEVLDYVRDHIRKRGYYFEDETLYNYHICLKTRPFVILAGLSGTGKSKLAQLYADALGQGKHFKRLSVRPNWNDDRYLLGHYNTLTGEYVTEPALEFLLDANLHHKNLYSLCLDEMNLAHVEYYFSQFLSAMEEEQAKDRRITLLGQRMYKQMQNAQKIPREVYLPDNLLFTGTINVDETTQPISDKVIDRANTIEFFHVDLSNIPERQDVGDPLTISAKAWQSYRAQRPDTSYRTAIVEINTILKEAQLGIGYRVVHEIEMYLANSHNLLTASVAFDLQIKQRILPRVRGTERIKETLHKLIAFSRNHQCIRTEERLKEMKNKLEHDGYTNFWR